jgi:cell division protein FtsB
MRITAPLVILACALVAAAFSFLSDDGFSRLTSLNKSLELQQRANARLEDNVQSLKRQVIGLQNDVRTVEKAARSELGMARPDELVVIFEKKEQGSGEDR